MGATRATRNKSSSGAGIKNEDISNKGLAEENFKNEKYSQLL